LYSLEFAHWVTICKGLGRGQCKRKCVTLLE